jgi:hypothetical protein
MSVKGGVSMIAAFVGVFRTAVFVQRFSIFLCFAVGACSMPRLEDPPNALARPPNFADMPKVEDADPAPLALQDGSEARVGASEPVQAQVIAKADAKLDVENTSFETAALANTVRAPNGWLHGQSTIYGVDLSDDDGLVCAGRPAVAHDTLHTGEAIHVACSDGSWGNLLIDNRDTAGLIKATLNIENGASKSVQLVER